MKKYLTTGLLMSLAFSANATAKPLYSCKSKNLLTTVVVNSLDQEHNGTNFLRFEGYIAEVIGLSCRPHEAINADDDVVIDCFGSGFNNVYQVQVHDNGYTWLPHVSVIASDAGSDEEVASTYPDRMGCSM